MTERENLRLRRQQLQPFRLCVKERDRVGYFQETNSKVKCGNSLCAHSSGRREEAARFAELESFTRGELGYFTEALAVRGGKLVD